MSDAPAAIVDDEDAAATALPHPTGAPPLPVEGHIVSAVRALEAAKVRADQALMLLQYVPRQTQQVGNELTLLRQAADDAMNAYWAYAQVLNCGGQA